jgi:hypothetical protein
VYDGCGSSPVLGQNDVVASRTGLAGRIHVPRPRPWPLGCGGQDREALVLGLDLPLWASTGSYPAATCPDIEDDPEAMKVRLLLLLIAGVTTTGCEGVGLTTPPTQLTRPPTQSCSEAGQDYSGSVVASFVTTVGSIRALEPRQPQPARWSNLPADHPAMLCYIDAELAKAPPPGGIGEVAKPFDRAVVAIVEGHAELIAAGYRDRLQVRPP